MYFSQIALSLLNKKYSSRSSPMNTCPKRATNCTPCPHPARRGTLELRHYRQRTHFPAEKQDSNVMLFILKGNLLINSEEYPGTVLKPEQAVLQAIGSKMELLAMTDVECIEFRFNEVPTLCQQNFREIVNTSITPITYTPLPFNEKLRYLIHDLASYLSESTPPCSAYTDLKCQELIYVMTNFYPRPSISTFFYPISVYTESFQYFVMKHYAKVRSTEEFAHLGGYSVATFRRLFKNLYGVPVYEWIINKRRESILRDLLKSNDRIGDISQRYGFDNLSHFSHFCTDSFGDAPRNLRKRAAAGESIKILSREKEGGKNSPFDNQEAE